MISTSKAILLLLLILSLLTPSQTRRLGPKSNKSEEPDDVLDKTDDEPETDLVEETDEDRVLPGEDGCAFTKTVFTDPENCFFDPELMQLVMLDTPVCYDEELSQCISPEGAEEYASAVCHVIDPCFEEAGCLSQAVCNQVVTEASKGVVMTGSGIAYFDLTAGEDAPITGTSEFLFVLLGVSGTVTSEFGAVISMHTVCYK